MFYVSAWWDKNGQQKRTPKRVREQCMRNMWRISYSQREETGVKISWAGKVIEIVLQSFELNLLLTRKKGTGVPLIETEWMTRVCTSPCGAVCTSHLFPARDSRQKGIHGITLDSEWVSVYQTGTRAGRWSLGSYSQVCGRPVAAPCSELSVQPSPLPPSSWPQSRRRSSGQSGSSRRQCRHLGAWREKDGEPQKGHWQEVAGSVSLLLWLNRAKCSWWWFITYS